MARQIAVKAKYDLWVKPAEKDAMQGVLSTCEDHPAFTAEVAWPVRGEGDDVREEAAPTTKPAPRKAPSTGSSSGSSSSSGGSSASKGGDGPSGGSVYFKNCDAVRAAGADPIHAGEPGYSSRLDRDGDGVGCE